MQPGNGGLGVESATSICASLQSQGCPGNGATCGVGPQPSPTGFIVVNPGGGAGSVRAMGGMKMLAIAGVMAGVVAAL